MLHEIFFWDQFFWCQYLFQFIYNHNLRWNVPFIFFNWLMLIDADVWMVKIKRPNRQRAPGQCNVVVHWSVSSRFGHSFPPFSGCWTTSLVLLLFPSPQVTEHSPHAIHSPTLQSTGNVKHCIGGILNNADCIYNVFKWHKRDVAHQS